LQQCLKLGQHDQNRAIYATFRRQKVDDILNDQKSPKRSIKMSDVAREAGVSPMTVSNAFKHPAKVVAETRERVFSVAARLGYVPNLMAGNLASGRSNIVAAIAPSIQNSNFAGMIIGLENTLRARGYHLIISVVDKIEREFEAVRALIGRRVDGIVLTGVNRDDATRTMLVNAGIPLVETWDLEGPFIDMGVGFSARKAAKDITRLMIASGKRRIGLAGYEVSNNRRFQERVIGFEEAMIEAGLSPNLTAFVPDWSGFSGGRLAMDELLGREPLLEGMFCFTDVLATGALFECMRRGWDVPGRFAIAGYGDYEIAAEVPPGLTTIHTPGDKIGEAAADMILRRINGGDTSDMIIDVGYRLVVRGSV
jgi:LacI family gluconate utilization system Gnt-I transcriptional repressor